VKIFFLGTNGWFDTETGVTPCILIDSKEAYIVLDAGGGIYKLNQHITDTKKPIYLFISHLHIDHIWGLHILQKFRFPQGMTTVVPESLGNSLKTFMNTPFTVSIDKLNTKTMMMELSEGNHTHPCLVSCFHLFHSSLDFGYRFNLEGKIISYSGDCGVNEKSMELAKNADILIHESSLEPGHISHSGWGHSNPEHAAQLAKDAGVGRLLLTHFDARIYTTLEMRKDAEKVAQEIFPNTKTMVDDDFVEI